AGAEPAHAGAGAEEGEAGDWGELPRATAWRDRDADWDEPGYEPALLGGDGPRLGALDETREDPGDLYSFDSMEAQADPGWDPVAAEGAPADGAAVEGGPAGAGEGPAASGRVGEGTAAAEEDSDPLAYGPGGGRRSRVGGGPGPAGGTLTGRPPESGGRAGWVRTLTGVAVGILALILFKVGPIASLALDILLVTMAVAELYGVLRRAGYRPATLVGLVGTICLMVAAYMKGQAALGVVVAITMVVVLLWYLFGIERSRPTVNLAATVLGFLWVGFLGSYAALLLSPKLFPDRHGVAFLLGTAIAVVAYDVGGLIVGSQWGRRPLAPSISPNKTWEGMIGGIVLCLIFSIALVGQIHPWDHKTGLALGVVVCVMAPLGDLCESLVKRDLGIKDMGSVLPGHGGVLDRIDAFLFVVPAVFYLVRVLNIG
ncbi:MAG: phosphatidate cytidylyltransferase, partial [Acidimicrobiales bacterium]